MNFEHIESHYSRGNLEATILHALKGAGLDPANLTPEDLAPVDEFHSRGETATREMAEWAQFGPEDHILDIGCGIGGPARKLAHRSGCRVTGLDLTHEYCEVARSLTRLVGLDTRVEFHHGNALALPFAKDTFDGVWTQHLTMNIADRARLYSEIRRVLKPGGRLAMYEIVTGNGEPIRFPVPWARKPANSYLTTPPELRRDLERPGFCIRDWQDVSQSAIDFFTTMLERVKTAGPPPLGLHVLVGPEMQEMATNLLENLEKDRLEVVQLMADTQEDFRQT